MFLIQDLRIIIFDIKILANYYYLINYIILMNNFHAIFMFTMNWYFEIHKDKTRSAYIPTYQTSFCKE